MKFIKLDKLLKNEKMKKLALFSTLLLLIAISSCDKEELGCTNSLALNFNSEANEDDGSCVIPGCNDPSAINFNSIATFDDNTCTYYGDLYSGSFSVTETCTAEDYNYTQEIT